MGINNRWLRSVASLSCKLIAGRHLKMPGKHNFSFIVSGMKYLKRDSNVHYIEPLYIR